MVLDTSLLNTQQYMVHIKRAILEKEYQPPIHLGVVAIEKGAFWLPSTTVVNFTYIYIVVSTFSTYLPKALAMSRVQ